MEQIMNNFTFNISLSILNHLGRNLYRNFITVLGEAISNSWDACAKNVWISIDKDNNNMLIKDDGIGMSQDDFQNKFLKIGYSKRKEGINISDCHRPYIGRKGIGKLALLSCAKRIHIYSKTENTEFIGGVIDNSSLDNAINDDLTPQQYPLDEIKPAIFNNSELNITNGTLLFFENLNDGIHNKIEYIKKLIALYFRFSIIDESFNIYLNDNQISLNDLKELASNTQFVWQINQIDDPFLTQCISSNNDHIKYYKEIKSDFKISGFIASVKKPSNLKINQTSEKVTIDLFVNGRLREKNLLSHIPSTRIVESYLYGQIHYDSLDDDHDRFTSSREGVISNDPEFSKFLNHLEKKIIQSITNEWDIQRRELNQEGDPENFSIPRIERKSTEFLNVVIEEYFHDIVNKTSLSDMINIIRNESKFNLDSYTQCFISENLLRDYIIKKNIQLNPQIIEESKRFKKKENTNKSKANISIPIRKNTDGLSYLSMDSLSSIIDKPSDWQNVACLYRDALKYKPIRDAMAHTALLTDEAKDHLKTTFTNIKNRLIQLLQNNHDD